MNDHEAILRSVPLFDGIRPDEWERMLGCLGAVHRRYPAGEFILMAGQPADRVGVLLEGRAQVLREEFSGARTILTALAPGDLFAEAFACASGGGRTLPVSVLATSDCRVLLIDYRKIITSCPSACDFHARLVRNMLAVLADKNLLLNRRLRHLSKRTTREKLLSYAAELFPDADGLTILDRHIADGSGEKLISLADLARSQRFDMEAAQALGEISENIVRR